jgi:hypothetical protein
VGPLDESRVVRTAERWLPLIVIVLAGILLATDLNRGWVPHDEGALGQAAERVLAGQVPHRDYDDIYTGALAYLHAAFFSIGSHASSTLRIPLFLLALPWVAALYAIARRFVPPLGAAVVAITALVWSVPNYPAAVPSWFNLFFATFGALALLRGLETAQRRWFILAGVAGGVSFLFKLSGVFYVLGSGIALIATSFRPHRNDATARSQSGAILVTVILSSVLVVLAIPIARAGFGEVVRFLVPLGALFAALIWREWKHGGATAIERGRALFETLGPFALGALLPLAAHVIFLLAAGALSQTIDGVLVKPFRRTASAMMHPPPPTALIYSMGLGLLLAAWVKGRVATIVAGVAAVVFAAVVYTSADNPRIYGIGVLAAWGLPLLAAAGSAWLITRAPAEGGQLTRAAVVITAIACATLLIEFPFAAPIYLLYTIPLSIVALAAVVGAAGRTPASIQLVVAGFLLVFGLVRVIPGSVESFGSRYFPTDETVLLKVDRSGLWVRPSDADTYAKLIGAVQVLSKDHTLWAGPDAPEVYFLSGVPNQSRTLFDFLDADAGSVSILERVRASQATLIVLKLKPDFSPPPDQATHDALAREFPNVRSAPGFLVYWK